MLVFEDLLTGDELLSDSFPYREIENGMLWEVDGKWVIQGAIDVDIGAKPSAEGGEDEGVDEQAVKVVQIDMDIGFNPSARWWLNEGPPLKSSGYGENWHESKIFALVAPLSPGDGSSSITGTPVPLLWLDSGAAHHVVGDAKILTNLRDPPTKMVVTVADGFQLPITKVGVIQAPNINISDVYLAPGLEMNLVSMHQLAKSEIVTIFYKNYAELWLEGERIGGAIVDNDVSLYRLCFFKPHA